MLNLRPYIFLLTAKMFRILLWIAFKFVSLYRMTQPTLWRLALQRCCELLSNLYLCIGWHRLEDLLLCLCKVVNCFQICIFVSDDTAPAHRLKSDQMLWIAFKFVSLYRMTQLNAYITRGRCGCELLSNLYLCIGWHSCITFLDIIDCVVNCFQICIFVSDDTALRTFCCASVKLWIAFKFISLYRMTQLRQCKRIAGAVVNCFQICIFVSDDTAEDMA